MEHFLRLDRKKKTSEVQSVGKLSALTKLTTKIGQTPRNANKKEIPINKPKNIIAPMAQKKTLKQMIPKKIESKAKSPRNNNRRVSKLVKKKVVNTEGVSVVTTESEEEEESEESPKKEVQFQLLEKRKTIVLDRILGLESRIKHSLKDLYKMFNYEYTESESMQNADSRPGSGLSQEMHKRDKKLKQ